jgi:hypothetical protein
MVMTIAQLAERKRYAFSLCQSQMKGQTRLGETHCTRRVPQPGLSIIGSSPTEVEPGRDQPCRSCQSASSSESMVDDEGRSLTLE